jgi:hypothetical protein
MNYAIAFLALIFFFSAVYWYMSGRKFYTGPLIEADIADSPTPTKGDGLSEENSEKGEKGDGVIVSVQPEPTSTKHVQV